jgi:hypothetical protein
MIPYISCHYVSSRNSRDKFLPDISLQRPRQHWKIVIGIWKVDSVNPAAILISKGMSVYESWGAYGFWTPELQKFWNKMLKPSFYDVATMWTKLEYTWVHLKQATWNRLTQERASDQIFEQIGSWI